jgi:hypothetical protein
MPVFGLSWILPFGWLVVVEPNQVFGVAVFVWLNPGNAVVVFDGVVACRVPGTEPGIV